MITNFFYIFELMIATLGLHQKHIPTRIPLELVSPSFPGLCESQLPYYIQKCVQRPVFTSSSTPVFWRLIHSLSVFTSSSTPVFWRSSHSLSVFTSSWLQSSADRSTLDKWDTRRWGGGGDFSVAWGLKIENRKMRF